MASPQKGRAALEAFVAVIESLGLSARVEPVADQGPDLVVVQPDGTEIGVELKATSLVTADSAQSQLRRWAATAGREVTPVVVADRITADARDTLRDAGWSWLDLRGHLRFTAPGVFVDSDVPALVQPGAERSGLTGRVAVELAALLLLDPTRPLGVRAAAALLSRAPSSISDAFSALRAGGLTEQDNRPVVPDLFWELAQHWKSSSRDVANVPGPGRGGDNAVLRLGLDEVESTEGWALTDTVAAAAYGAPVSMRADHPLDFYVPDQATLHRAVALLGPAESATSRAGRIRVAPVPMVCTRRVDATAWAATEWPLAQPLFVALDLAQDPGRGREILDAWTPRKADNRVW